MSCGLSKNMGVKVVRVNAEDRFLEDLKGVTDQRRNAKELGTPLLMFLTRKPERFPT